tara:strand:- start:1063 stop:1950 length:888 start_codon:yes stop_codon:yes gene_type:complete
MPTAQINKDGMYDNNNSSFQETKAFRDDLYNRFNRQISLMLDAKKPRTTFTDRGRLEPRRAYRYNFSKQLFKVNQSVPTGDTTVIFMIDGSGSMSSGKRLEKCSAICSAFAKSVNDVTKNQIKFEVFVKHAPSIHDDNYGGSFVSLTKVLSNVDRATTDFDKILKLDTRSPFRCEGDNYNEGSFTSEFAVLPALRKYMAKRLTTKNAIIVNLTDGEAYCSLGMGDNWKSFGTKENGAMRTKYLSNIPHVTVIVGGGISEHQADVAYGNNRVECEDSNFVPKLFSMFMKMLESQYE